MQEQNGEFIIWTIDNCQNFYFGIPSYSNCGVAGFDISQNIIKVDLRGATTTADVWVIE